MRGAREDEVVAGAADDDIKPLNVNDLHRLCTSQAWLCLDVAAARAAWPLCPPHYDKLERAFAREWAAQPNPRTRMMGLLDT